MSNKYSLTIGGIIVAIAGSLLVQFGFSDGCSNEIIAKIMPLLPVVVGGGMSYVGRLRIGDVNALGFKK